jgi:pilus assembly protein CpaE
MTLPPSRLVVLAGSALSDDVTERLLGIGPDVAVERMLPDQVGDWVERFAKALVAADARVCVLGPDLDLAECLELGRIIDRSHPEIGLVMVATATTALWRDAARAGITELVEPDAPTMEFALAVESALVRALRLAEMRVPEVALPSAARGRVSVVLSPKGGSGKTMVASNVAVALSTRLGGGVVLVDLDCAFGDVATALGLEPERTLGQLADVPRLDSTSVKVFLTQHPSSGLFALCSAGGPEEAESIDETTAREIIEILRRDFAHVIIDTAAGLDERALAAIDLADDLVLVASMDVASVRNMGKELDVLDRLGAGHAARILVANKVNPKSGMKVAEVEQVLGLTSVASIEMEAEVVLAMNQGIPLVIGASRSQAAKGIWSVAERIGLESPILHGRTVWRRKPR